MIRDYDDDIIYSENGLVITKEDKNPLEKYINKEFTSIIKRLKALDIIKKYVGVRESYDEFFPYEIVDKQYVSSGSSLVISKEEYDLLKEVLL